MKIKIPGTNFEAEVVSERKCLDKDAIRMACTKASYDIAVAGGVEFVPGTKGGYFCTVCNCELVLAPSGQRLEAMGGAFTCQDCVLKMVQVEEKGN
jgi:hypothetical protein